MILKPKFNLNNKRFIFQQVSEKAPRAPETFKAPEKATDQEIAAEVAPMTPSQIVSTVFSAGSAITAQHVQNTQAMANLINDPLISAPLTPLTDNTPNASA